MSRRLVEGIWDCEHCERKEIKASIRYCPGCGNPQNANTKFRLPSQISYVPETIAQTISRNPNWICNHCGGQNRDNSDNCLGCGATRDGTLNYFENSSKKEKQINIPSIPRPSAYVPPKNDNTSRTNIGKITLIIATVLMVIAGIVYLLIPKEKVVTVQQMLWERTVTIQRYQTVNESDWSIPEGGRLKSSREEFSHYEPRLVGYETKTRQVPETYISGYETGASSYRDLGNGYFEEVPGASTPVYSTRYVTETYQEPIYVQDAIYRMKYYYEIERWLFERSTKTTQENSSEPYWGEDDSDMKSDERISARNEQYFIIGIDKDEKTQTISIPYSQWCDLNIGQTIKLKISIFGTGEVILSE